MLPRSLATSASVLGLSALVLLGAGCGRADHSATGTGAPAADHSPSAMVARDGGTTAPRSACDHPYYPLRTGYEIHYRSTFPAIGRVSSGSYSLKVTNSTSDSVTLAAIFDSSTPGQPPITSEQIIDCSNGGLRARSYLDLGSRVTGAGASNRFNVITRNSSGEMLPQDLHVGSEWHGAFDVTMQAATSTAMPTVAPDSPLARPMDLSVSVTRRAIAEETVRVPAGEYQALKVSATTNLGLGTPITGTEWWVRGVGMVKSSYDLGSGSENIVTEATSVNVP